MIYALSFGIGEEKYAVWVRNRRKPLQEPTLRGYTKHVDGGNIITSIESFSDLFPKRRVPWIVTPFVSKSMDMPRRVILRRIWEFNGPLRRHQLMSWTEGYELFCQHVRMML